MFINFSPYYFQTDFRIAFLQIYFNITTMAQKATKVLYEVTCYECKKVFEKVIEIETGSEDKTTDQITYCPFCYKMVKFEIKGKPREDLVIRKLKERGIFNIQFDPNYLNNKYAQFQGNRGCNWSDYLYL